MFSVRLSWQDRNLVHIGHNSPVVFLANFVQRTKEKQSQRHRCLVESKWLYYCGRSRKTVYWEKEKEKARKKKDTMGWSVTPWKCRVCSSVKKLLRVSQKTLWLYLFIVAKKKKRRFFIAALICQLIIFSYTNPALVPCIHPVSYHDPCRWSTRRPLGVFSFYERSCYVQLCTQLGINHDFTVHGRHKWSFQKGRAKRSWTTDVMALNIPGQIVIYSAPG